LRPESANGTAGLRNSRIHQRMKEDVAKYDWSEGGARSGTGSDILVSKRYLRVTKGEKGKVCEKRCTTQDKGLTREEKRGSEEGRINGSLGWPWDWQGTRNSGNGNGSAGTGLHPLGGEGASARGSVIVSPAD